VLAEDGIGLVILSEVGKRLFCLVRLGEFCLG
jgi:hypothetical protein